VQALDACGGSSGGSRRRCRRLDGHVEDVGDALAPVEDLERLAVVAFALADLALDVDIGEEVHLDLLEALALARLAAAAAGLCGDVEAEAAGLVAADLGLLGLGEDVADLVEDAGVGGGIASGACGRWGTGRPRSRGRCF
jgi:hypothetical protein